MLEYLTTGLQQRYLELLDNPLVQGIGLICFLGSIYNFLFCKDRKFIVVTGILSALWGFHYLGLSAFGAAFVNFFDVLKNFASLKWERNKKWMWGFVFAYIIIGIVTVFYSFKELGTFSSENCKDYILALLPTFLAIFSTFLVFWVRGIWLKIGFLFVVILYLVYNYSVGSMGGVATDIFILCFSIIGITKDILAEKNKK